MDNWKVAKCKPIELWDRENYIHVKSAGNLNIIYCYGNKIQLDTGLIDCPNYIFQLPITTSFTINNMTYSVGEIDVIEGKYNSDEQFIINSHLAAEVDPFIMHNKLNDVLENNWFNFGINQDYINISSLSMTSLCFLLFSFTFVLNISSAKVKKHLTI